MMLTAANITVAELGTALDNPQTHVIDVREMGEYTAGHVPGANWIPMATIPLRVSEIPADKDVYVICQSGGRSAQVCAWLARNGIEVTNVLGGTGAWVTAGLPIETGMASA